MLLKDVLYRQAMEGGAEGAGGSSGSDSEGEGGRGGAAGRRAGGAVPQTYDEEQRELKRAFLQVGTVGCRASI